MKNLFRSFALLFAIVPFISKAQFVNPLFIPDTLAGPNITLNIQSGTHSFFPGTNSPSYGYNGSLLGPTLIWNKDDSIHITANNQLGEETTIHWHGLNVPAEFDGGPHSIIDDGTTWNPSFKIFDVATTMWYHPHLHANVMRQVGRGLAGLIIVRDQEEAALDLPRTYGVDDFPIILQDKGFDSLGQIIDNTILGEVLLVNGTPLAFQEIPAQVVRFRMLNGSAQRVYYMGFSDNRTFHVIGNDGGLLDAPVPVTRIKVAAGERYEIIADFSSDQGDTVHLRTFASELPPAHPGGPFAIPDDPVSSPIDGIDSTMLELIVGPASGNPVTTIPTSLVTNTPWDEIDAVKNRTKQLSGVFQPGQPTRWLINGQAFLHHRINDTVLVNSTETWEIHNASGVVHPFHIHDGHFYILEMNGQAPPPEQAGKKDVVLVGPNDRVKFIMKFERFTDEHTTYMYHCHLLAHEDAGMMAQFIVVDSSYFEPNAVVAVPGGEEVIVFPNPAENQMQIKWAKQWGL